MSLTRWCEDICCLGVELSDVDLKALCDAVSKIADITNQIKRGSNPRPQRSDTWFRTTFMLDSRRSPELYFNFSLGTFRLEICHVKKIYAVRCCNWTLYPNDTSFNFNFGRGVVRDIKVTSDGAYYYYHVGDSLDDAVRVFNFLVKEFQSFVWTDDDFSKIDVKGFYNVY